MMWPLSKERERVRLMIGGDICIRRRRRRRLTRRRWPLLGRWPALRIVGQTMRFVATVAKLTQTSSVPYGASLAPSKDAANWLFSRPGPARRFGVVSSCHFQASQWLEKILSPSTPISWRLACNPLRAPSTLKTAGSH